MMSSSSAVPPQDEIPDHVLKPLDEIERYMLAYLERSGLPANLLDASRYALLGGGKRLRPLLTVHASIAAGGSTSHALPAAAAVEMIHAFSLVHDDLPALDNDDLRRGRPTVHKAFSEPMAVLVGDGLMSMAFQVISECCEPLMAGRLCRELAEGSTHMIAGQVLDTLGGFASGITPAQKLELIHHKKTGALIRASCRMGAISGLGSRHDAEPDTLARLTTYGESIGLMFQIVDDLLDVLQSADHTGKRTGKDQEAGKLTYPGILGIEASQREVERLRIVAQSAIEPFKDKAESLRLICDYLAVRTK